MPVDATAIIGLLVGFLVVGVIGIYRVAFIHSKSPKNVCSNLTDLRINTREFKCWRPDDSSSESLNKRYSLHFTTERYFDVPARCYTL